jgi:hypothetical protein
MTGCAVAGSCWGYRDAMDWTAAAPRLEGGGEESGLRVPAPMLLVVGRLQVLCFEDTLLPAELPLLFVLFELISGDERKNRKI